MNDLFIETKVKLIGKFSNSDFSYPQHGYMYVTNGIKKGISHEYKKVLGSVCNGKTKIYK